MASGRLGVKILIIKLSDDSRHETRQPVRDCEIDSSDILFYSCADSRLTVCVSGRRAGVDKAEKRKVAKVLNPFKNEAIPCCPLHPVLGDLDCLSIIRGSSLNRISGTRNGTAPEFNYILDRASLLMSSYA